MIAIKKVVAASMLTPVAAGGGQSFAADSADGDMQRLREDAKEIGRDLAGEAKGIASDAVDLAESVADAFIDAYDVGGRFPLFVDCGMARGMDAFKAIALGATAVSAGKAVMAGMASAGAAGVTAVLNGMTDELRRAMSLTSAQTLADIDSGALHFR